MVFHINRNDKQRGKSMDNKKHDKDKINKIYCFCALGDDGNEGIAAFMVNQIFYPMVGADERRVESLMVPAQDIVNETGTIIRLCEFGARKEIKIIRPNGRVRKTSLKTKLTHEELKGD